MILSLKYFLGKWGGYVYLYLECSSVNFVFYLLLFRVFHHAAIFHTMDEISNSSATEADC